MQNQLQIEKLGATKTEGEDEWTREYKHLYIYIYYMHTVHCDTWSKVC